MNRHNILILGASYGSLLATKLQFKGHRLHLVCLPPEAQLINREGTVLRIPVKGREGLVEIRSHDLPGQLSAGSPGEVDPSEYDLVALAMQEPQYRVPEVRQLLEAVAKARVPCLSIMNMPPLPYLARIPGLDAKGCRDCYTDASVWDAFDPDLVTLCSPDPQAFRPPEEALNVLQVRLPTNFKAAAFVDDAHTAMLRGLAADIEAARFATSDGELELPVKLKVHDSVFVPLAKWSMLLAGNYRCIEPQSIRSIKEAVHGDLSASQAIYEWVVNLCLSLGAKRDDLVPFDKYANAALSLQSPSSAARAIDAGVPYIERVDQLVQTVAAQQQLHHPIINQIVSTVDQRLQVNQAFSQQAAA